MITDVVANIEIFPWLSTVYQLWKQYNEDDLRLDFIFSGNGLIRYKGMYFGNKTISMLKKNFLVGATIPQSKLGCNCKT